MSLAEKISERIESGEFGIADLFQEFEQLEKNYLSAVSGRREFRSALSKERKRIADLERQLAAAQKDSLRLDHMQSLMKEATIRLDNEVSPRICNAWAITAHGNDLREAIDAAIDRGGEE